MASQLELPGETELRQREKKLDRNAHLGGRSFYFFDFDDNIASLLTPMFLIHEPTGEEKSLSSREFAEIFSAVGQSGPWKNYRINWDDHQGSFRSFRDHDLDKLKELGKSHQLFVEDVLEALGMGSSHWQGPSWNCFVHATHNQRPTSLITARGHHPDTIRQGVRKFVEHEHLTAEPNYLGVFPVHHPETRQALGDLEMQWSTALLKKKAIRRSVELAFSLYGPSTHHRFGMSDDDPRNLELIFEVMHELKNENPENGFFVIETLAGKFVKHEVLLQGETGKSFDTSEQLALDFELVEAVSSER